MSATNDSGVKRYALPGVPNPILPADVANKAYVDSQSHVWGLIGQYTAAVAEATATISFPAIDMVDDSKLVLVIDGETTAALELRMRVNALVGILYFSDGRKITGGVETLIDNSGQTSWALIDSTALGGVADFGGTIDLYLGKAGLNTIKMTFLGWVPFTQSNIQLSGFYNTVQASISSVTLLTSASTWKVGTRFSIYRVRR